MHNYTQTPVRNRPSYLFLRRYTGEAIVLLAPRHSEVWIRVIEIDVDDLNESLRWGMTAFVNIDTGR